VAGSRTRFEHDQQLSHACGADERVQLVERTFAWLGQARRLSKDYERLPAVSEAMIYGAMSRLMLRRLTRSAA
jgi:transposase